MGGKKKREKGERGREIWPAHLCLLLRDVHSRPTERKKGRGNKKGEKGSANFALAPTYLMTISRRKGKGGGGRGGISDSKGEKRLIGIELDFNDTLYRPPLEEKKRKEEEPFSRKEKRGKGMDSAISNFLFGRL